MRHLGVETNRVIFKTHGPEMFFFPSIFLTTKTEACGVLPSGPWGTFVASRGRLSGADLVWNCKLQILGRDCEGGWGGRVVIVGWLLGIVGLTTKKLLILPVTRGKTISCFKDFYEKWQPLRPPSRSQPAKLVISKTLVIPLERRERHVTRFWKKNPTTLHLGDCEINSWELWDKHG